MIDAAPLTHLMHVPCIVLSMRVLPTMELCAFVSGQGGSRAAHLASNCSAGNCGQIHLKVRHLFVRLATLMPQHPDLTTTHDKAHNNLYSTCVRVISVGKHELNLQVITKHDLYTNMAFCMHDASATTKDTCCVLWHITMKTHRPAMAFRTP
jgi:hypothetical protein